MVVMSLGDATVCRRGGEYSVKELNGRFVNWYPMKEIVYQIAILTWESNNNKFDNIVGYLLKALSEFDSATDK